MIARVTAEPIRPAELLDQVGRPGDGAVVLFLGTVRDHADGRPVTGLHYEAYREMAEPVLWEIVREAGTRSGASRIAAVHRTGSLEVGDVSVAIAVASPHRDQAYEASRYVIEEIKRRLPVWKREAYADGAETWVEGHVPPAAGGAA